MQLDQPELGIGSKVKHPTYGEGVVMELNTSTMLVFFGEEGDKEISRSFEGMKVLSSPAEVDQSLDLNMVKSALREVIGEMNAISYPVRLASRYEGGNLELKPANPELKSKEVPIETFFHKIVMVRDRLRVLEQNINSHEKLSEEDKIHLQQYISRAYGSLTTFNVLFDDKEDYFKSK